MRISLPALVSAYVLAGCVGEQGPPGQLRGTALPDPWPKPDFSLVTTEGESFDFLAETDGYVTLLFFGYTNCPDVCPVHMANIAAVLRKLPPAVAGAIKVVFVTTDPERDTPERLESWLNGFDTRFIGLTGPLDIVNEIQRAIGLAPAMKMDTAGSTDDNYIVGHAAQVVAYTRDNRAHVVYPFGTRQEDWAHDLPILVAAKW
jgi:protein SCO1/2